MGRGGALSPEQKELRTRYAEGLVAYRTRHWEEARRAFGAALAAVADDGPSLTMLDRIGRFAASPPADDWDGAWRIEQK
jgi:hypothetical protein